ncbi:S4 domain-containing protein, partial [Pseudomonas sp.]|uniref:S4 domain-containing protein n=1 Tax=Pseudomonas sp. TaxID=306 RepID=UPI002899671B
MTEPTRLSKRVAEQLGCSRREAELYIEGGWVKVNDQIIDTPYHKVDRARI